MTLQTKQVAADEPRLLEIFKKIHANPELSMQETETSALVASEFKLVDEASKLNLNTATVEMLQLLPRMTPELAAAITSRSISLGMIAAISTPICRAARRSTTSSTPSP